MYQQFIKKILQMKTSQNGINLIKQFEGFEPEIYQDAAGYATIGYGHLILPGEDFSQGITRIEARRLLQQDVRVAEAAVMRLIHQPLRQPQFDALVSFTFNLGSGALQRSTLRRKINRAEHQAVPYELLRWVWAGGRKLRGLVRRRRAEGVLYFS
jgi:lysozyme